MNKHNTPSCVEIINSLWIRAGAIYYLDHVTILGSLGISALLGISFNTLGIQIIDKIITFPLRTLIFAWTLSRIIEILSLESRPPQLKTFLKIIPKGFWVSLAFIFTPWIIHMLIWITFRQEIVPIELISALLTPGIALWTADAFIRIKYADIPTNNIQEIKFNLPTILTGAALLSFSFALYFLGSNTRHLSFMAPIISIFYLQTFFLSFAVFAKKILDNNPHISAHFHSQKTLIIVNPVGGVLPTSVLAIILRNAPPFGIVLKSLTPPDYQIIEYNRLIWQKRYFKTNSLIAISCFTSSAAESYGLAREFRQYGSKVIMGGPHVMFFPDEALEFCDSVVIGPAESVWETIIHDYENNCLKKIYYGDYSPVAQKKTYAYLLKAPSSVAAEFLQASRGCKFNCYFCSIHAVTRRHLPERSIDEITTLVKHVSKDQKSIAFIDNNLYIDPDYAKKLFKALIPLKIKWSGDVSIDITKDEEALSLLKPSGCHTLLIGFEITPASKEAIQGGKYDYVNDYIKLARKIQKQGIKIKAHFIFGFPGDNFKTLFEIWLFCFKLSPSITALSFLTPLPGSKFFLDALKQENIINLNWVNYDIYQQVYNHPKIGQQFIFKRCYMMIMFFFFLTTSTIGRIALLALIAMECVFLFAK